MPRYYHHHLVFFWVFQKTKIPLPRDIVHVICSYLHKPLRHDPNRTLLIVSPDQSTRCQVIPLYDFAHDYYYAASCQIRFTFENWTLVEPEPTQQTLFIDLERSAMISCLDETTVSCRLIADSCEFCFYLTPTQGRFRTFVCGCHAHQDHLPPCQIRDIYYFLQSLTHLRATIRFSRDQ